MFSIILLLMAILNVKETRFEACLNEMFAALIIWCSYVTLEIINDTCGMAWDFSSWYTGARMMAYQLMYAFLVFTIYISTPKRLIKYLYLWGALSMFAVFWIWKQKYIGFTQIERGWLQGSRTHILAGGTLIRYFSTFNDAASAGIYFASSAVAFLIIGITSKVKKYKYIFLALGGACTWAMFPTGTRTAIACFLAGFMVYTLLSKSVKLASTVGIAGLLLFFLLAFTNIGQSNQMIRRMRSAFNSEDASANLREQNQAVMKKYLAEAPFGIGVGLKGGSISSNHKFYVMSTIAPDSEYVYIWIHTGTVGIIIFIFTTFVMFFGASRVVLFKLTSSSLRGIGGGLVCAFVSVQLGGYGNQVLMQFPLCMVFYGALSIVYALPFFEKEWVEHEGKLLAKQEERKRLRNEKKKKKKQLSA